QALFSIIPVLPQSLPITLVVVQHFPKHSTKELARRLNEISEVRVEEAYDGVELKPGTVWLAPGGLHAEVERNGGTLTLKLHRGPRENGVRPSIDLLFRSAGWSLGDELLGIILSGCGRDGIAGARVIREYGGNIIVQDPRDALSHSLPLAVIREGLADNYFPAEQIADQIIRRSDRSGGRSDPSKQQGQETGSSSGYWVSDWDDSSTHRPL
ncbi:MAG: CheB methylesterase domain-containing protein, partial [Balneolaceae bacterium]|nr:CheB methylesterase domain-containing protein [Balneolaceae bacterium]